MEMQRMEMEKTLLEQMPRKNKRNMQRGMQMSNKKEVMCRGDIHLNLEGVISDLEHIRNEANATIKAICEWRKKI